MEIVPGSPREDWPTSASTRQTGTPFSSRELAAKRTKVDLPRSGPPMRSAVTALPADWSANFFRNSSHPADGSINFSGDILMPQ